MPEGTFPKGICNGLGPLQSDSTVLAECVKRGEALGSR